MTTKQNPTGKRANEPKKKQKKRLANHRIRKFLSPFSNVISLTTANISRIFVLSVACVKLTTMSTEKIERRKVVRHTGDTRSIALYCLHKLLKDVIGSLVDIGASIQGNTALVVPFQGDNDQLDRHNTRRGIENTFGNLFWNTSILVRVELLTSVGTTVS
jgi:hypothetical protein